MRYFQFSVPSWGVGKGEPLPWRREGGSRGGNGGEGEAGFVGRGEKYKKYKYKTMVLIHISLDDVIGPGGQTLERAATVCYHGVVKRLIRALVLEPISKPLLVGHSF